MSSALWQMQKQNVPLKFEDGHRQRFKTVDWVATEHHSKTVDIIHILNLSETFDWHKYT